MFTERGEGWSGMAHRGVPALRMGSILSVEETACRPGLDAPVFTPNQQKGIYKALFYR